MTRKSSRIRNSEKEKFEDEKPEGASISSNKNKITTESRTSKKIDDTTKNLHDLKVGDNPGPNNEKEIIDGIPSCTDEESEDESEDEWSNDEDYDDSGEEWTGDDYHDMDNVVKKDKVKNKKDHAELEPIVIPGAMTTDGAASDYEKIREDNIKAREDMLVKLMADIHLYKQDNGLATPSKTVARKEVSLKVTPALSRSFITFSKGKGQIKKIKGRGQASATPVGKKTVLAGKVVHTPAKSKASSKGKQKTKSQGNIGSVVQIPSKKPSSHSVQETTDFTDVLLKIRRRRQK